MKLIYIYNTKCVPSLIYIQLILYATPTRPLFCLNSLLPDIIQTQFQLGNTST